MLLSEFRDQFPYGTTAWLSDNIRDEQQFHPSTLMHHVKPARLNQEANRIFSLADLGSGLDYSWGCPGPVIRRASSNSFSLSSASPEISLATSLTVRPVS